MASFSRGGYSNDHRLPTGQISLSSVARQERGSFATGRNHDRAQTGSDGPNDDRRRHMEAGRRKTGAVSARGGPADSARRVGRTRSASRAENVDWPEQMNAPHGKAPHFLAWLGHSVCWQIPAI